MKRTAGGAEITKYPFRRYLEIACGVLGWPPEAFWRATPHELLAALDGWLEKTGARDPHALTSSRLDELIARYPDSPPHKAKGDDRC